MTLETARCTAVGPLRGGVNFKAAAFGRERISPLRFNVEVFLPVHVGAAFKNVFAAFKSAGRIAQQEAFGRDDELVFFKSHPRVGDDFQRLDVGGDLFCGCTGTFIAFRQNQGDWHSLKVHVVIGQQRFIGDDAADLVFAPKVFGEDDLNDALHFQGFLQADSPDYAMRHRRIEHAGKQGAVLQRQVV